MKNRIKLTNRILPAGGRVLALAPIALLVAVFTLALADGGEACGPAGPNATVYLPNPAFLQGINTDETASFGGTGTLNSIEETGDGVVYNVTFGAGADVSVSVDSTFFGPYLNLWSFTATEVNTEVVRGSATIQMLLQDGSASYNFQVANGPNARSATNCVVQLEDVFSTPSYDTGVPLDQCLSHSAWIQVLWPARNYGCYIDFLPCLRLGTMPH